MLCGWDRNNTLTAWAFLGWPTATLTAQLGCGRDIVLQWANEASLTGVPIIQLASLSETRILYAKGIRMANTGSLPGSFLNEASLRPTPSTFTDPKLFDWLDAATATELDTLSFGVVAMALDGTVEHYNTAEGKLANLTPARVVGKNFFTAVAPCTNNFMVAERFASELNLDVVIDYVFTLRMAPKKVHLRLMRRPSSHQMFLVVERRK